MTTAAAPADPTPVPRRERRPRLHITPATGWLNDPNGLVLHDGVYHVFHQANPDGMWFGRMIWDHQASTDLIDWQRRPTALVPSPGPDAGGCWSGCIVVDGDVPTAVYTAVEPTTDGLTQAICLARGDASLDSWQKDPANPVLVGPPTGSLAAIGFRDPFVWRDGSDWAMVIGSGKEGHGGSIELYRSPDLIHWQHHGALLSGDRLPAGSIWTGRLWECPQFVELAGRHLLVFSVWDDAVAPMLHYPVALVGGFDGRVFVPEQIQRLDLGPECYAPALLRQPGGRVIAWAWSMEDLDHDERAAQGWAGCLTMPRELWLDAAGTLRMRPAREIANARQGGPSTMSGELRDGERRWSAHAGDALDLTARFEGGDAPCVGLVVAASPQGDEETVIRIDRVAGRLELDRTRSSCSGEGSAGVHGGSFELAPDEPVELRVLLDRTIVEVFVNDRVALTARIYPAAPESVHVAAFADGGSASLASFGSWALGADHHD